MDESGCDRRAGSRRTGWAPLGETPTEIAQFQREQRYQILPAYTVDGIIHARVLQGSTDSAIFEDFIEEHQGIEVITKPCGAPDTALPPAMVSCLRHKYNYTVNYGPCGVVISGAAAKY